MPERRVRIPIWFIFIAVLLNIIARISPQFAQYYVNHIFPLWVESYGRVTGLFPFSVGEMMLYLGVVLAAVWILWGILECAVYGIAYGIRHVQGTKHEQLEGKGVQQTQKRSNDRSWNQSLLRGYRKYSLFLLWVVGMVCLVMTLNCLLLYQAPTITERNLFVTQEAQEHAYGIAELTELRDEVVEKANALAQKMERDENGYVVSNLDIEETARQEMKRLGETYPELAGYYPKPKKLKTSAFFSQQYIMGYYFPFSMEANYNTMIYITNQPSTLCHELSHLKGFILEDEANFIGYLACLGSEEELFQYSAYLSVIAYLDEDFYRAVGEEEYWKHPEISVQVRKDSVFLTKEAWAQVEEKAVLETTKVKQVSYDFLETTLTLNGVEDGLDSYSRVVQLLLLWNYEE